MYSTPTAEATMPTMRGIEPKTGTRMNTSHGRTRAKHQRRRNAALPISGAFEAFAVPPWSRATQWLHSAFHPFVPTFRADARGDRATPAPLPVSHTCTRMQPSENRSNHSSVSTFLAPDHGVWACGTRCSCHYRGKADEPWLWVGRCRAVLGAPLLRVRATTSSRPE